MTQSGQHDTPHVVLSSRVAHPQGKQIGTLLGQPATGPRLAGFPHYIPRGLSMGQSGLPHNKGVQGSQLCLQPLTLLQCKEQKLPDLSKA